MKITLLPCNAGLRADIRALTEDAYLGKLDEFGAELECIDVDGTLVGWMHLRVPSETLYDGFLFIYVAPEYRRRGVASEVYRIAESRLNAVGCGWWSSYPESDAADSFAMAVGFDYTNTNSYLLFEGELPDADFTSIRVCTEGDYPTAPDIWSREYAEMHRRLGLPYEQRTLTDAERAEEKADFLRDVGNYFVIEEDGRVVGVGTLFSDNSGIGSLAVDSRFSGKGYGTRLAAYLTRECIIRGNQSPCVYCESNNADAMHIYKKLGYVENSRESVALKRKTAES